MIKLSVTVSGSFHRHIDQILDAVNEFKEFNVRVLSPADPRVVDSIGPFIFVASDQHRSIRLVQDRHLAAIAQSDFLWLVSPDGYIGQSASLELGFAIAYGIPIFCNMKPPDPTLRQYVMTVNNIQKLLQNIYKAGSINIFVNEELRKKKKAGHDSLLIDPINVVNTAHKKLEEIERSLHHQTISSNADISPKVLSDLMDLKELLDIPTFHK